MVSPIGRIARNDLHGVIFLIFPNLELFLIVSCAKAVSNWLAEPNNAPIWP